MPQRPFPTPHLHHRPARQEARGGALGTVLLALAVVGLIAFVALATFSKDTEPPTPSPTGAATQVDADVAGATTPAQPTDPDELGLPPFSMRVLPFRDHSAGLPVAGTWLGKPTLADLDGDGDLDLVASNREEDGVGTWRFDPEAGWKLEIDGLPRNMSYGPSAVVDVDGDGKPDLLIGDHTQALRMFANDGDMHYSEIEPTWERPNLLIDIDHGDLDRDGHADIVAICHFKGGLNVYLGNGSGGLRYLPEAGTMVPVRTMGPGISRRVVDPNDPAQLSGKPNDPMAVAPGDLFGRNAEFCDIDGDAVLDVVATTNEGLKAFLTRPGEPFTWEEVSTGLPAPSIGNSLYGLDTGVFDESRPGPQVLMALLDPTTSEKNKNAIGIYAFDAETRSWTQIDSGLFRADDYKDAQAADFDGDGHLDVIAASLQNGRVIFRGDGKGGFEAAGRIPGHAKCRFALGDVDGDGLVDVMAATSGVKGQNITGKLRVFLNTAEAWR